MAGRNRSFTTEQRQVILEEWRFSGISASEFARFKGLSERTLRHWTKNKPPSRGKGDDNTKGGGQDALPSIFEAAKCVDHLDTDGHSTSEAPISIEPTNMVGLAEAQIAQPNLVPVVRPENEAEEGWYRAEEPEKAETNLVCPHCGLKPKDHQEMQDSQEIPPCSTPQFGSQMLMLGALRQLQRVEPIYQRPVWEGIKTAPF